MTAKKSLSETEAIAQAKLGDEVCFKLLYGLHKRRVYSLCLRMVRDVEMAEDLTQEAFLQLHRKIATFRGDSAFSTWLHRLTTNIVLMHIRKKRPQEVSLDETLEVNEEELPKREYGRKDNNLEGSLDRITLERAIDSLPPGYRMIFVLHDIEGYEPMKLPRCWDALSATASRSFTKRVRSCEMCFISLALNTRETRRCRRITSEI